VTFAALLIGDTARQRVRRELVLVSEMATFKKSPCSVSAKGLTACIAVSKSGESAQAHCITALQKTCVYGVRQYGHGVTFAALLIGDTA